MADSEKQRDKQITREIHRLFWRASLHDKPNLIFCYLTRTPAMLIYNVLIPVAVAYGLQAIIAGRFGEVDRYAWWVLGLAGAYGVLWAVGGKAICRNAQRGSMWLQRQVFANYLQKDYEFYANSYMGALNAQASKLRDSFNEYSQLMVQQIPKQTIIVLSSVVVIGLQSLLLAAVTLFAMLLVLSYTIYSSRWRLRFRRKLSEATSQLSGVVGDALSHGATVKSFASEDYEQTRLDKAIIPWSVAQYRSWMASIPADVGRMILAAITTSVLLVMTARMYQVGDISIAIVVLVQLYVVRLVASTLEIADLIKTYEVVMGGVYEAVKTMLIEPSIVDPVKARRLPKKSQLALNFRGVVFRYNPKQRKAAVNELSLEVRKGEKVGLVGYSGSGKTTLTKLLLRFADIQDGSISLGGIDIRDLKQRDLRHAIAYVPQEPLLFHRSIADNIGYGNPKANLRQVLQAAEKAYVHEFVRDLPLGYDTLVGERGVKLSGGQRQRVAIARALLKDAPILVLDEATSALDSRSEQLIQKALWKLMKDRTALVIAHRLSTIQRMDRIAVMDKGKIVQLGTHEELLRDKKGIYAELWTHQSGGYVGALPTES